MAGLHTYNAARITVVFAGFPISGFADGTFVHVTMVNDGITTQVGADGEIARAINTDRRCTVTLTLQQTSESNDFLSTFFNIDMLTCGGRAGPILIQDLCGTTLFMSAQAWIVKMPDMEYGKEILTRAWQLQTTWPSVYNVGGNPAQ